MKFGKIVHIGIVVRDLEKAVSIFEERLGIKPFELDNPESFFDTMNVSGGRGLKIRTATYRGGDCEIELVMPTGEGLYMDWLNTRGPGLHHIKFDSEDSYEAIVGTASQISGRPPYLEVRQPDGTPLVAYADLLEEAGLLLEVNS